MEKPTPMNRQSPYVSSNRSRREFLAGAGGLLLLGAAGCGGGGAGGGASSGGARTIEHKFGSTEIEGSPERVVAVGYNESDFVLAAGVVPVGVRDFIGPFSEQDRAWAQDALGGGRPELVGGTEIDFEAISMLEPDLILGIYSFVTREDYELLSEIAPTVAQPGRYADGATPWQEQMRLTGRALGRDDRARRVVKDVEARFAREKKTHPEFEGKTMAVVLAFDGAYTSLGPDDLRTLLFTSLGFGLPEETGEISSERLDLLDEDLLVVLGAKRETLQQDEILQNLDVVRGGRTIYFGDFSTPFSGALGYSSPLSLPFALDVSVPLMSEALSSNP